VDQASEQKDESSTQRLHFLRRPIMAANTAAMPAISIPPMTPNLTNSNPMQKERIPFLSPESAPHKSPPRRLAHPPAVVLMVF
jgi:hypothetical protein